MNICGQEFDFSLLNANDLDRLEDAIDEMTRDSEAETARCDRENVRLGDRLRAQARVSMRGLDKILGRRGLRTAGSDRKRPWPDRRHPRRPQPGRSRRKGAVLPPGSSAPEPRPAPGREAPEGQETQAAFELSGPAGVPERGLLPAGCPRRPDGGAGGQGRTPQAAAG